MLNKIVNYYRIHRRIIKKDLRTNYTRPMKNTLHSYKIQLIRQFLDIKSSFFQLKNLRFVWIFVIMFWLFRDFAFAAENSAQVSQKAVDWAVDLLNWVIFIITLITQPLVMLIWWLLSPDWTFWDIFWLRAVIHDIWIIVSNIVYFIFAIMLIIIALMNIFSESKSFALKSALPRLVVGILIVPFTWFIVSATLSVWNVLTASVLSFSSDSIKKIDPSDKSILNAKIIPKTILIDLTENSDWAWSSDEEKKQTRKTYTKQIVCKEDWSSADCLSLVDMISWTNWAYNLMTYYAYWIFKIDTLKNIWQQQTEKSIKTIWDIFKKLTFSVIFALIFAILVIAIAFALLTRMAMMWIYAMFSPLFALSYFLWWKWPKWLEKIEKKLSIKSFISLALVPTYVAAALSFWLIFLSYAMNSEYKWSSFITLSNSWQTDSNWDQSIKFWQWKGEMELKIIWKYTEWQTSSWVFWNTFAAWQWIITNVIISFLALIILWMAVMAALWASDITEKAVKPIAEFWDSIGKLMVDAPKYIPLKIPGTDGKSISLAWVWALWQSLSSSISNAATATGSEYWSAFWKQIAESMWLKMDGWLRKAQDYVESNKIMPKTTSWVWADLDKVLSLLWKSFSDFASNQQARDLFSKRVSQIDDSIIKPEDKKSIIANINKWTEKWVQEALKLLEEKVGYDNFWWMNNNFDDVEWARKVFENYKSNTTPDAKPKPTLAIKDWVKKDWNKVTVNVNWTKDWKQTVNPVNIDITTFKIKTAWKPDVLMNDDEIVAKLKIIEELKGLEKTDIDKIVAEIKK